MIAVCFAATLFAAGAEPNPVPVHDAAFEKFVAACEWHLSHPGSRWGPDFCKMARRLARDKKWDTIQMIFSSNRCNFYLPQIAREIVSVSSGPEAVAFLQTIPRNTHAWGFGMLHLPKKQDAAISAYLKVAVKDKDPSVRATCYALCGGHYWPDLIEQARADSESLERYHPAMGWSFGLADSAKAYRVAIGDLPADTLILPPIRTKRPSVPAGEPLFPTTRP